MLIHTISEMKIHWVASKNWLKLMHVQPPGTTIRSEVY